MASSRSGLYYQPYREPAPGRWISAFGLEYASVIEYNRLSHADYVLDSELLRVSLGLSRDLGQNTFVTLGAGVGGAYAGFLDGFLDWYHGALRRDLFLEDMRVGLGLRASPYLQTVFSVTFPTSTGPEGYGRGVPSVAVLNTVRAPLQRQLLLEGSIGVGYTPAHGSLPEGQRQMFLAATSGLRWRVWGSQSVFANVFYHSPYYHGTTLPALDGRELSLDFGWILQTGQGGEWRVGMTEDLEPGGPGVDLIFRLGRSF
jgi:hypothetical protein